MEMCFQTMAETPSPPKMEIHTMHRVRIREGLHKPPGHVLGEDLIA